MITVSYKDLLFPIKKVPLVVDDKTKMFAGHGIVANGQVVHQTLTDFSPRTNESLLDEVSEYYRMRWKYAYCDYPMCNFSFTGVIDTIAYNIDSKHTIQPGIEVLNSYNQRMSPQMYYLFYHLQENCYIKTDFPVEFLGIAEEPYKHFLKIDELFNVSISEVNSRGDFDGIPAKILTTINDILPQMIFKYGSNAFSLLLAVSKANNTVWEHSSYELSRKNITSLLNKMLKNTNKFAYASGVEDEANRG